MTKNQYGYACEYCAGTILPRLIARKVFKHKPGFVLLENVVISVRAEYGNSYYSTEILYMVHKIATSKRKLERLEPIQVVHLSLVVLVLVT